MNNHWSDCAIYNEPASKAGDCDCGGDADTAAALKKPEPKMQISRSLEKLIGDKKNEKPA